MPTYLEELESESIFLLREVKERFKSPVLLFSGGKDSACLLHLAEKAFFPDPLPFPILHIDTGCNFPEVLRYRDKIVNEKKLELIVRHIDEVLLETSLNLSEEIKNSKNRLQGICLREAIKELGIDCAVGGARRDEEKARAKERLFSLRGSDHQWKPEDQRPELRGIYNTFCLPREHFRVFPISNWTEEDIWAYIDQESIEVSSLYFSHWRDCIVDSEGRILPEINRSSPSESSQKLEVRCRTIGDETTTGLISSSAKTIRDIREELQSSRLSERGNRRDDQFSDTAMEDRKREGYF